jgi:uncharacterized protein (TIGR02145 family)
VGQIILFAAGFVLTTALALSCSSDSSSSGAGTCDANFRTETIGTQTWMAENLNCNVGGSKCYDNNPANCAKYGRLYDWSTAMNIDKSYNSSSWSSWGGSDVKHRGICPSGWHIPNYDEWVVLRDYVGGYLTAGRYLKATSRWNSSFLCEVSCNGTDEYGFSALPGGHYSNNTNRFASVGDYGIYWSASENNSYGNRAYILEIRALENVGLGASNENKPDLNSVRCIQD